MLYDQIARNKRRTALLFFFIALFITVFAYIGGYAYGSVEYGLYLALLGFGFSFIFAGISYFTSDKMVLAVSGAKEAKVEEYKQLHNIVEEVCLAGGLPKPKVFVIADKDAPNAFATGRDPNHASIAVTQGLLDRLNREELQAVIAHEMGHVQNFDILYATLMGVMVGSLAMMSDLLLRLFIFGRGRRRSGKGNGQAQLIMFIIAIILAILAPILAKIIQFAMSRERELLADATGAYLTRNPQGLISALRKISKDPGKLEMANRATQHMFFFNPLQAAKQKGSKAGLFSTHPTIAERIARLKRLL